MLYVLYGNRIDVRKNLVKHLDSLQKKRPDAEVFRIKEENYSKEKIIELLSSQGLFSNKYIVVLDFLLEKKDSKEEILEFLKEFKESEHIFLLIEEDINKKELDQIKEIAEKIWFFPKEEKKEYFNIFSLANDLGRKDKKNLWLNFLRFTEDGVSGEEIVGVLFWQMKNIMIAKKTKNSSESKLSPFADKNARFFSKNWSENDVLNMCNKFVLLNEKVRNGEGESEILLEKLILEV